MHPLLYQIYLWTILQVVDDPSGNSFIENPLAPNVDPLLSVDRYNRTSQQEEQLGIIADSTEKQVQRFHNM
jgi:hypothetical protein